MIDKQTDLVAEGCMALKQGVKCNNLAARLELEALFHLISIEPLRFELSISENDGINWLESIIRATACAFKGDTGPYLYPFAKMMRGICLYFEGDDTAALSYLTAAKEAGLDNILMHLTAFLIYMNRADSNNAGHSLNEIRKKSGNEKLRETLQGMLDNPAQSKYSLNPIKLFIDSIGNSKFPSISFDGQNEPHTHRINNNGFNSIIKEKRAAGHSGSQKVKPPAVYAFEAFSCMTQKDGLFGLSTGMVDKAYRLVNKSIKLNARDAWVYWLRSWILYEKKEYHKALDDINAAMTAGMETELTFRLRALIHLKLKNYEHGVVDIEKALQGSLLPFEAAQCFFYRLELLHALGDEGFLYLKPTSDI